jgi:outer membrane protein OmpA-like peptidoglycan-associated protein
MRQSRFLLGLLMLTILGACSNHSSFVNHLNTSFSNWHDDPYSDEVKVYALDKQPATEQTPDSSLAWKKEQSQKVIDMVQFDFDNATVSSSYTQMIRQQAEYVQHHPQVMLRVAGHADERGSREYNVSLGCGLF